MNLDTSLTMNPNSSPDVSDATPAQSKSFTRHITTIARILMGLPLFIFGLNGFLHFIPEPKMPMPEGAMAFVGALVNTGYMMQLIGATLLVVGALLLTNRFVPLALALFAPFIVNSLCFHIFLEHSGLPMACVFLAFELYLAWTYRRVYAPMLAAKVTP